MTGKTHAIVGANAIWITALASTIEPSSIPILLVVGAIGGLLPDIDAETAKIHFIGGGVLGAFRGIFTHRSFFHSLLAVVLLFLASTLALSLFPHYPFILSLSKDIPLILTIGYASHLLIDGFNKPGVEYLFPLRTRFRLVPRALASPLKGFTDQFLFVLGAAGLMAFLLQHLPQFSMALNI